MMASILELDQDGSFFPRDRDELQRILDLVERFYCPDSRALRAMDH